MTATLAGTGIRKPWVPPPIWPGITYGFDARCTCTWAMSRSIYQVKIADKACIVPGHAATIPDGVMRGAGHG